MPQAEQVRQRNGQVGETWPEDDELVRRLHAADEAALEAIMKKHSSRIMSTAFRVLRTRSEAEEVTQDVFLALWQQPNRFDAAKGPLITWLLILARSRALDLVRQMKARSRRESQLKLAAVRPGILQCFAPVQNLVLQEILGRLPPKQERVIRGAYFDGYALCEIAELQRLPLGTVKGRVRFAIKRLRSELAPAKLSTRVV